MTDERLFYNMVRKMKKSKPTGYIPHTVSIFKLCQKADKLQYFNQIRNRILRELEQHESMGDYVRFDPNNMADLFLDDDGVFIFCDILYGYFPEQDIIDLWKYTRDLNRYGKMEYDYEHLFDNFTVADLKEFIKGYIAYEPEAGQEEAKQMLLDKAHNELKNRKRLFSL